MAQVTFRGGVHPADRKAATSGLPIERASVPARVLVPLSQHLGAPAEPRVAVGDAVLRGQCIGDVDAMVSAPVHAPVSGFVTDIRQTLTPAGTSALAIEIEATPDQDLEAFVELPLSEDTRATVRAAGIVGLGGAAFPTHVKLNPPKDSPISTVILNGCECEPFLTCDDRLMVEDSAAVVDGGRLIAQAVGAERIVIGIEDNKPEAARRLGEAAAGSDVEVLVVPTRYPQGAEKQLIWSVLGAEVPHGKLPAVTGALVHNVGTASAVAAAVQRRRPLFERVVTVTGAVRKPGNYLTVLGTPVSHLLEVGGGLEDAVDRVIAGGPMTGFALGSLDVPVVKGTSGIVALRRDETAPSVMDDQPCIRCARCTRACPMMLQPWAIGTHSYRHDWDATEAFHAVDCIECGCCSYICPTRRPLVQLIKRSKQVLMQRGSKL